MFLSGYANVGMNVVNIRIKNIAGKPARAVEAPGVDCATTPHHHNKLQVHGPHVRRGGRPGLADEGSSRGWRQGAGVFKF